MDMRKCESLALDESFESENVAFKSNWAPRVRPIPGPDSNTFHRASRILATCTDALYPLSLMMRWYVEYNII